MMVRSACGAEVWYRVNKELAAVDNAVCVWR
jgi:hypothetical protein